MFHMHGTTLVSETLEARENVYISKINLGNSIPNFRITEYIYIEKKKSVVLYQLSSELCSMRVNLKKYD